ncbi:MAG: hypothetical protein HZA15_13570 [Nitrospirae bacterium]|nr:hypothetical protein [Nitrospirota bacterium]
MINKNDIRSFSFVTILYIAAMYLLISPVAILAMEGPLDAKLNEIEKQVNVLWEKTHHFEEGECPSKENAAISKKIINELETIRREKPRYKRTDQILFMLAQAKSIMVVMCNCYSDQADYCRTRGEKEYGTALGFYYVGVDYEDLIRRFPKSPYLEHAIFYHTRDRADIGECEGDMNCYVGRSIDAYLPYIRKYPNGGKLLTAITDINFQLGALNIPPGTGGGDFRDLKAIDKLLKTYHVSVLKIKNKPLKDDALYYLARGYIAACRYDIALSIYDTLEKNSSKYRYSKQMTAYEMFGYRWENKLVDISYNKKVLTIITALQNKDAKHRLKALNEIKTKRVSELSLFMPVFMEVGRMAISEDSPAVRKAAILAVESYLSESPFSALKTNGASRKYDEAEYAGFPYEMNYFNYAFLKPIVRHCFVFEQNKENLELCQKLKTKYDVDVCSDKGCN